MISGKPCLWVFHTATAPGRNATIAFLLLAGLMLYGCTEYTPPARTTDAGTADSRSRAAGNPLRNAYFGDLHLHTVLSFDAAASGTRTMPDEAYRFARGEPVSYFGRTVQRRARLDFLAVTDHAEYLGVAPQAARTDGPFAGTQWPARLAGSAGDMLTFLRIFSPAGFRGEPPIPEFVRDDIINGNWRLVVDAAERHYRPGVFTTFVAFEWSPMPGGAHLHRNVLLRGPRYPDRPYSAIDSMRPEDLWTWAEARRSEGIDVLLIPHNSNFSAGLMFNGLDSDGAPVTAAYARRRSQLERLVEITQNKGSSETRPEFSPNDEFAGFELINFNPREETDPAGGYIRPALGRGLAIQAATGSNPYAFGLVGGTDFHSGISAGEEDNFPGGLGSGDEQSDPARVLNSINPLMGSPTTVLSAGGLTGIWAEENTRESLFAALMRREVFATSGSRIRIRMFAGRDYPAGVTGREDWLQRAYRTGVPMGSTIPAPTAAKGSQPVRILLQAVKDPDGANLDRIEVVKIWYVDGLSREQVFDAVWAGRRATDPRTGRLPPIGNTVDPGSASYRNSIGAAELLGEWIDPDFQPDQPALYYARVLEIPTPRWTTYLAVRNGLPLPAEVPPAIQARAWTSPVFHDPRR